MDLEWLFRLDFVLSTLAMTGIRAIAQDRLKRDQEDVAVHEGKLSLVAGAVAALVAMVFGLEYVVAPGTFTFAYSPALPRWVRWVGAGMLPAGIALLGWAHTHLGKSFHSMIVTKEEQVLVDTGPYATIRHPIYLAYLLAYLGGGLVAGNWVLTLVPLVAYGLLVVLRIPQEERVMVSKFGDAYDAYRARTGRLIPRLSALSGRRRAGARRGK